MMSAWGRMILTFLALVLLSANAEELRIIWFNFPPCFAMKELVKQFDKATVSVDCNRDIGVWHDDLWASFQSDNPADLVVLDSQWIGQAVTEGHLVEITDLVNTKQIPIEDYFPETWKYYSEYPLYSGKYYGVPLQGDVQAMLYRSDIIPRRGLPADLDAMLKLAQNLTERFAGQQIQTFAGLFNGFPIAYDALATTWNQIAWMYGGDLWDTRTYQVAGILNSTNNINATDYLIELTKYGHLNDSHNEIFEKLCTGKAIFGWHWMSFAPSYADPAVCPHAGNLTWAVIPPNGNKHILVLGGGGMHIAKKTKHLALATEFLLWLQSKDIQQQFGDAGGLPVSRAVVASERFLENRPWNEIYYRSFSLTKDYWNIPEYNLLLSSQMEYLRQAMLKLITPKYALDTMAAIHQAVIDEYYPYGPNGPPAAVKKDFDPTGIAVGVSVGGVALIAIAAGAFIFLRRRYNNQLKVVQLANPDEDRAIIEYSELEFGDKIGVGSSGEVYKGAWRGTQVTIKKLRAVALSAEKTAEFTAECKIMAQLRHPNVVLFMGACVGDHLCIVIEFMTKGSVYDILHDSRVPLKWGVRYKMALDAARGMSFLHGAKPPIIHRDLKTPNLLVDDKWRVKVSDFGLTYFATEQNKKKKTDPSNEVLGSVYWAPPEVLLEGQFSMASDVYSYGIMLWEIMTQKDLYKGKNQLMVAMEVCRNELRPEIPSDCPENIAQLMRMCWSVDPSSRPTFPEILRILEDRNNSQLLNLIELEDASGNREFEQAPSELNVSLVFTDVECSTELWEFNPTAMQTALKIHNTIMRRLIRQTDGYEVKTEGDSFMIAFSEAKKALQFCLCAQKELLAADWNADILEHPAASELRSSDGDLIFKGLKVRMGFHTGSCNAHVDEVTGRHDYFGPTVNRAARISSLAQGGQIYISSNSYLGVMEDLGSLNCEAVNIGEFKLKGLDTSQTIYEIVDDSLKLREFTPTDLFRNDSQKSFNKSFTGSGSGSGSSSSANGPAMVVPEQFGKWVIPFSQLQMDIKIGVGSYGEVYKAKWRGQEVAVKKFLRKRMHEDVMLDLRRECVIWSELRHPNILLFMGASLNLPEVAIVTEYLPKGNLMNFLADSSNVLSWDQQIHMCLDIARGMNYLHEFDPPIIHRDLKSSNLLVDRDLRIKIADFGFTRIKEDTVTMTRCGTLAWTAPEVIKGVKYSQKADIYSFGIVMWEIATRKSPFQDYGLMQIGNAVIRGQRPTFPSDINSIYVTITNECWDGTPSKRPPFSEILDLIAVL